MSPRPTTLHLLAAAALAGPAALGARPLGAQTEYYNLDAGRPTRVEDASPTERSSLELQLAPLRLERADGGTQRWRAEPKLSYGVLPYTEIELRAPLLVVTPPGAAAVRSVGLAGAGVGVLHALTTERGALPAVALSAEALLPVGGLAPGALSYTGKAVVTKTTRAARLHLNVAFGTFAVRTARVGTAPVCAPGDTCDDPPPVLIDTPCDRVAADDVADSRALRLAAACAAPTTTTFAAAPPRYDPSRTHGSRWLAGVGVDRAFPLASALVVADLVAERFVGLYGLTDWTAELGVRRQLSPRLVFDFGVARHFAGVAPSSSVTVGATYSLALGRVPGRPEER